MRSQGAEERAPTRSGDLSRIPFPRLLLDLLVSGRSGVLHLGLHPEPRNRVELERGIPVRVDLPDVPLVPSALEVADGSLDRALEVPGSRIPDERVRRAEGRMVSVCALEACPFRFDEGPIARRPGAVVLHPLALVFRGLLGAPAARARCMPPRLEGGLAKTYPRGSDPFRWGPRIEGRLGARPSARALLASGVPAAQAEAALACLHLTRMLAPLPAGEPPPPRGPEERIRDDAPSAGSRPGPPMDPSRATDPGDGLAEGLLVHRRSGRVEPATRSVAPPSGVEPSPSGGVPALDAEEAAIQRALEPYRGKSYLQILRVTADTEPAQVERAFRHFVKRVREGGDGPGAAAAVGVLFEAFAHLRDPEQRRRYAGADQPTRRKIEAEVKAERALITLAEGRPREAVALARWACALVPDRSTLGALLSAVEWLRAPVSGRSRALETALAQEAKWSRDPRLHVALIAVLAKGGELGAARSLWRASGRPVHPLLDVYLPAEEA